jgi:hypothetical protein
MLVGLLSACAGPAANRLFGEATVTPSKSSLTKEQFINQLCTALEAYEGRHQQWHAGHTNLNDHHWDASFVPIVQDPLLPAFENPPLEDHAQVAAMRAVFENASAKFDETARHWAAGDKAAAEVAESEAFQFIFGEFPMRLKEYGVRCAGLE